MRRDGALGRKPVLLNCQQLNGIVNTASVRVNGYEFTHFHVMANAGGGLTFTAVVQHSDDDVTFANAPSPNTITIVNTLDEKWILVDHQKLNQYVRLRISTDGNMSIGVLAVQSNSKNNLGGTLPDLAITG